MRKYFDCNARNDGHNWLIAWIGTDSDGKNYNLETYNVHASELTAISAGAKGDGELIADLMNWYYNTGEAPQIINEFVKKLDAATGIVQSTADKHAVILAVIAAEKAKAAK